MSALASALSKDNDYQGNQLLTREFGVWCAGRVR